MRRAVDLPPLKLEDPDGLDWTCEPFDAGDALGPGHPEGHWILWTRSDGLGARTRLDLGGSRISITEVWVTKAPDPRSAVIAITAMDMRDVPLGRFTAVLNDPRAAAATRAAFGIFPEDQPPLDLGADFAAEDPETAYKLQGVELTRRPDSFYRDVAMAWSTATARGSREPAAVIAAANDVPATTVYRWVREARRRGVMAPSGQRPRKAISTGPGRYDRIQQP